MRGTHLLAHNLAGGTLEDRGKHRGTVSWQLRVPPATVIWSSTSSSIYTANSRSLTLITAATRLDGFLIDLPDVVIECAKESYLAKCC